MVMVGILQGFHDEVPSRRGSSTTAVELCCFSSVIVSSSGFRIGVFKVQGLGSACVSGLRCSGIWGC